MDQQQQKRSAAEAESLLVGVKSIVFDIEGTTTPLSFHTVRSIADCLIIMSTDYELCTEIPFMLSTFVVLQ